MDTRNEQEFLKKVKIAVKKTALRCCQGYIERAKTAED
jgi:hypothetical protein